jgi:hypothetical protein
MEVGHDSTSLALAGFLAPTTEIDEKSSPTNRKLVSSFSRYERVVER